MKSNIALLFGIATAALIGGMIAKGIEEGMVDDGIKKARDALFEVAPDCTSISFKGGGDAPDPATLRLAEQYYFAPFVTENLPTAEAEAELMNTSVLDYLTARMLYQLFPECSQAGSTAPWPPESLFTSGSFGVIWVGMKYYMAELVTKYAG
jgi:hypothetical protein